MILIGISIVPFSDNLYLFAVTVLIDIDMGWIDAEGLNIYRETTIPSFLLTTLQTFIFKFSHLV